MKKILVILCGLLILASCGKKEEPITPPVTETPPVEVPENLPQEAIIPVHEQSPADEIEFAEDLSSILKIIDEEEASVSGSGSESLSGSASSSGATTSTGVLPK